MSSELAVVTAEIVDILPPKHRTEANIEWVQESLQQGCVNEVLAMVEKHLGVSSKSIAKCESRLDAQGIKLDRHIEYVDQKFKQYDEKINELEKKVAVQEAVGNERTENQKFLSAQMMNSINSTQQTVANVATKAGRSSGETNYVTLAFGLAFGVIIISCMAALASRPSPNEQIIRYKNVPNAGHPTPVPQEQWDRL